MDVFFIYGLVDSEYPEVVRYVGQTRWMHKRFKQHKTELGWYCGPVSLWKWSLQFFGRSFDMRLLEVVYGTREDALSRESVNAVRLAASGRILNGVHYRYAQRDAGLPPAIVESYLCGLKALSELVRIRGTRTHKAARLIAGSIDRLETTYRSLMICEPHDCFERRVFDLFIRRENRLDETLVSR